LAITLQHICPASADTLQSRSNKLQYPPHFFRLFQRRFGYRYLSHLFLLADLFAEVTRRRKAKTKRLNPTAPMWRASHLCARALRAIKRGLPAASILKEETNQKVGV
jgi:hypothetical protein